MFFEFFFARGVTTKDWKYITVSYDENTHYKINNRVLFKGWNNIEIKFPCYLDSSLLGYHAALLILFYFKKNELFDMKTDSLEMINVFEKNRIEANEIKSFLLIS